MSTGKKVIRKATSKLHKHDTVLLTIEELAELMMEIELCINHEGRSKHMSEEIADVNIFLNAIKAQYQISNTEVLKAKVKLFKRFDPYAETNTPVMMMHTAIYEMAKMQQILTKAIRGRHNRKGLTEQLAVLELIITYLLRSDEICADFDIAIKKEKKKLTRLKHRVDKNKIL